MRPATRDVAKACSRQGTSTTALAITSRSRSRKCTTVVAMPSDRSASGEIINRSPRTATPELGRLLCSSCACAKAAPKKTMASEAACRQVVVQERAMREYVISFIGAPRRLVLSVATRRESNSPAQSAPAAAGRCVLMAAAESCAMAASIAGSIAAMFGTSLASIAACTKPYWARTAHRARFTSSQRARGTPLSRQRHQATDHQVHFVQRSMGVVRFAGREGHFDLLTTFLNSNNG